MAELRPDIEALEQAMADFQEQEDEPQDEQEAEPVPEVKLKDPTLPGVPELTIDTSIEETVHEAQETLARTNAEIEANAAPAKPAANSADAPKVGVPPLVSQPPTAPEPKVDPELMKIAVDLGRAKSIEDVDDKMAETLFGEELNLAAAELIALRPEPANQDMGPEAAAAPAATPTAAPAPPATPTPAAAAKPTAAPAPPKAKKPFGEDALEVSVAAKTSGGTDLSASQRLATVRALNTGKVAPAATPPAAAPGIPIAPGATTAPATPAAQPAAQLAAPSGQPASFEDQIHTEMTQTFQALNSHPRSANDDDDDDAESKTGFFSRFKRS